MKRALPLLLSLIGCLPAGVVITPPAKFGIYEPATILEPNEHQVSIGHAQPILPAFPGLGQNVTGFLELDTRLRRGFTDKLEGQASLSSMLDFGLGAGRAGVKYALPGTETFHWALAGGAALGFNGRNPNTTATTRTIFSSADAAILFSGPRYWKVTPYGAIGTTASATPFLFGVNEDGVKDERPVTMFTPHVTAGVDIGFSFAHILLEATPLAVVVPGQEVIPNFLVAGSVAFTVGKVRYLTPTEKALPKDSDLCEVGTVEVDGVCYLPCKGKMARCPLTQVCVIASASPRCITGIAQRGTLQPSTEPTSAPDSESSTTPTSQPDVVKDIIGAPESKPTKEPETRDDVTICLAKNDGVSSKDRLAICQRYLASHPNDPSFFTIQGRIIELQRE